MTVAELIEHLKGLPPETRVVVVDEEYGEPDDVEEVRMVRIGLNPDPTGRGHIFDCAPEPDPKRAALGWTIVDALMIR